MERLTEYVTGGIRIKGCSTIYPDTERKGAPAANAIVRLAAYEDTGLEPCDYAVMRSAMDQAKEATQQLSDVVRILGCSDIDRLKDLAQAEKDGRLVVLPDAKYTDADGEKALQKAMWDCCNTNNPVTRYTADAIAEKLCREARAENPPLTLEELREMAETHEPVWCTHKNGYVFIATTKTEPYNQVWFFNHKGFWDTVLYYHTKFYRRRPEEGTI